MADNELGANGLTDVNHQRIIAASYTNFAQSPIMSGCVVSGTSGMTYQVSSGVIVAKVDSDKAQQIAVVGGVTGTTTAPASGTAVDTIYFDIATGQIKVARGDAPAGACILDRRIVPAGITATTSTTSSYDRNWALPYGATVPTLAQWWENAADGADANIRTFRLCDVSFYVPTDRLVWMQLVQCICSAASGDWNKLNSGMFQYTISLNGALYCKAQLGYDLRWERKELNIVAMPVPAGRNVISIDRAWPDSTCSKPYHFGGGAAGYTRGGVYVFDQGVRQ